MLSSTNRCRIPKKTRCLARVCGATSVVEITAMHGTEQWRFIQNELPAHNFKTFLKSFDEPDGVIRNPRP
eukprot:3094390-Rhodomonas_salina.1